MATNRLQFLKKMGLPKDSSFSIEELAELTDLPVEALYEIRDRGVGAWKNNLASIRLKKDFSKNPDTKKYPRSARLTKENWSMGRIYAFLNKSKKVFYKADADIAEKYKIV
jgi:hypothetical protein